MPFEILISIILAGSCATLALLLWQAKSALTNTQESLQKAFDVAVRAEERAVKSEQILNDFLAKPIQNMIPVSTIDTITQAIVQSLNQTLTAPMEVPIFPREKNPKEPK